MTTSTDKFLQNAAAYAEVYPAGVDTPRPATGVTIVTCMDARIDVFSLLGLKVGDCHIIRNAGGLVTDDVLRSLAISQRFLGTTEIILFHHTNCGMEGLDDEDLAATLEQETGSRPTWKAGGFSDPFADVRLSLQLVRENPFVPSRDKVRGFVFDVATGRLHEVE